MKYKNQYNNGWYTVSEAVPRNDWLCAQNASLDFYDFATELDPIGTYEAFRDVFNLIRYANNWPSESMRRASFRTLLENVDTLLRSKENTEAQLATIEDYKNFCKKHFKIK